MPNKPRTFFSHSLFSHISLYCLLVYFSHFASFCCAMGFLCKQIKVRMRWGEQDREKATNFISQTYQNHLNQHNDEDAEIVIDADNVLVEHCQRCI